MNSNSSNLLPSQQIFVDIEKAINQSGFGFSNKELNSMGQKLFSLDTEQLGILFFAALEKSKLVICQQISDHLKLNSLFFNVLGKDNNVNKITYKLETFLNKETNIGPYIELIPWKLFNFSISTIRGLQKHSQYMDEIYQKISHLETTKNRFLNNDLTCAIEHGNMERTVKLLDKYKEHKIEFSHSISIKGSKADTILFSNTVLGIPKSRSVLEHYFLTGNYYNAVSGYHLLLKYVQGDKNVLEINSKNEKFFKKEDSSFWLHIEKEMKAARSTFNDSYGYVAYSDVAFTNIRKIKEHLIHLPEPPIMPTQTIKKRIL